jgi:hypothetical protein
VDNIGKRVKQAAEKQIEKLHRSNTAQLHHDQRSEKEKAQPCMVKPVNPLIKLERVAGLEPVKPTDEKDIKTKG